LPSPVPADRAASRFRLPIEPPTRQLLIASLSSIAGACQLFAWALARLPWFFLGLGVILIGIAVGVALAALVRHYRLRWVAYVGPDSLTVVNGSRRRVLPWDGIGSVQLIGGSIEVLGPDGGRRIALPVDRTRPAHEAAAGVLRAIDAQLAARR
jgi:Bacterial PH domain